MYLTTSPLFAPAVRRRPALDTTFDRALTALARSYGDVGHRVEGSWNDGTYQLTVDLPGTPEEAVGVSVAGRTLTITVAGEGDSSWTRRLRLAQTLDPEQVSRPLRQRPSDRHRRRNRGARVPHRRHRHHAGRAGPRGERDRRCRSVERRQRQRVTQPVGQLAGRRHGVARWRDHDQLR